MITEFRKGGERFFYLETARCKEKVKYAHDVSLWHIEVKFEYNADPLASLIKYFFLLNGNKTQRCQFGQVPPALTLSAFVVSNDKRHASEVNRI